MQSPLSITIITKNEEHNILRALKSAVFAREIVIVDSFSTDKTLEVIEDFQKLHPQIQVKVYQRPFENHGAQKNLAASLSQFDWIFNLDADECIDPALEQSIIKALKENDSQAIYSCKRKNFFDGSGKGNWVWIRYGGWYPDYNSRLYHKKIGSFTTPAVHEVLTGPKTIKKLEGDLLHYSFPSFISQVKRNVYYSQLGNQKILQKNYSSFYLKLLILFKPLGKFMECYFLKLGFLDGYNGFIIALNASYSIFLKYASAYYGSIII